MKQPITNNISLVSTKGTVFVQVEQEKLHFFGFSLGNYGLCVRYYGIHASKDSLFLTPQTLEDHYLINPGLYDDW